MVDFQFCFIGNSLQRSTNNRYGYCFADDNKFCMIIPIFIILRKKSAEYRKSQFKTINAEFEVKDDKVYLNGREAVITFFHAEDGIHVLSVSMLFDKFSGYALMDTEIEAFVKFAAENRFPINVKGCTYPKNK